MYVDKERQINQPCFRFVVDSKEARANSAAASFFYFEPVVCW